ncbi:6-bladed beta-propeller [Aquiflexum sp. TKW24L]|uniref:6-bladed beta-propeller n=1 Tax=Aquiflexum sp. TKW24L TaxID=2942212 RepID=UPI0020C055AE|nr:6-bladed beta-propeller [Aquiflexum sp. TKW24L]MCL6258551.1 6-bladed beta-propeller [Aquiflexum sp. TKW24L]
MLKKKISQKICTYLIISIVMAGCKESPDSGLVTIPIPNSVHAPVLLSEMSQEEARIQLETKNGVFLGHIFEVKLHRNRLLISDIKRISIFDMEGNFIQFLGKQGEGPGEYKSVTSMDIDEATGNIYVSAWNKLMVYDSNYQLIEERKLDYHLNYLKILDGELWTVSEEIGIKIGDNFANQTNIYKLDDAYQISDTIPFRTIILDHVHIGGAGFRFWLSDIEEGLYMFMPVLTPENMIRDTLYQVMENNIVVPAVKFQFERKQSLDESGYQTLLLINIFNSTSYYILEYEQDWERFKFLYDKKNKKGYNLQGGLIDEDGDPVFLRPLVLKEDLFYYIKKFEFEDKTIEEKNPIIGIVKLN